MAVSGVVAFLVLMTLSIHMVMHTIVLQRQIAQRQQLANFTRHIGVVTPSLPTDGHSWHAADFNRFAVPAGLRLGHARRVIHEAREHGEEGGSG
jgi:hypothetical protein